jgi:hypothetical protein
VALFAIGEDLGASNLHIAAYARPLASAYDAMTQIGYLSGAQVNMAAKRVGALHIGQISGASVFLMSQTNRPYVQR